jgi:hypothetical protein
MAIIEVFFYALNIQINAGHYLKDAGGSIIIHTFGAFFGIFCTLALHDAEK